MTARDHVPALSTATALNVRHISLFFLASIPVENSSMRTTDGLPINAIASDSFLWFPPESLLANRSAYTFNPVASRSESTLVRSSSGRSPLSRP